MSSFKVVKKPGIVCKKGICRFFTSSLPVNVEQAFRPEECTWLHMIIGQNYFPLQSGKTIFEIEVKPHRNRQLDRPTTDPDIFSLTIGDLRSGLVVRVSAL